MSTKCVKPFLILLTILFLSFALASAYKNDDSEVEQCKEKCQQMPHYDVGMKRRCEEKCEEKQGQDAADRDPKKELEKCRQWCSQSHRGEQQAQRQCQQQCEERYKEEEQRGSSDEFTTKRDPKEELRQCKQRCRQHGERGQTQWKCEQQCEERYREEKEGRETGEYNSDGGTEKKLRECKQQCRQQERGRESQWRCEERCEEKYRREGQQRDGDEREEKEEEKNPYLFGRESFQQVLKSENGYVKVLQNFAKKSMLLLKIANYRIAILQANPQTFVMPNHKDADAVYYVAKGCGIITLVNKEKKESFELKQGDIIKVPAGAITYMVNRGKNEKLTIVQLVIPVTTPGHYQVYFGAGGAQNPQSFYESFSDDVLEAAFNTRKERLKKLFGGEHEKEVIRKISEEQVRALSRHASEGGHSWPFGESNGPYRLLSKRAMYSSQRGQLHEADSSDYPQLKDLDLQVSFANITGGSMIAPFYNTRATKIAVVTEGKGYFETICPHMAEESQEQRKERGQGQRKKEQEEEGQGREQQSYKRIRSQVQKGSVVIIPAGHPAVTVASKGQNLQVVCYEISAENNVKNFLAGKNNVYNQLEREAKELAFGMPAREVDEVLGAQREEIILAGPEEQSGRRGWTESMLESVVGY